MPNNFLSPDGDLEKVFITDYRMVDQYVMTGSLWAWGQNNNGQLGDNSQNPKSSPVQTVVGGAFWKQVSGGVGFSSGIRTDGTLWTWGTNTNGQLGDNTLALKSSPVQTISGGTNWNLVSCGGYFAAAIKTDGTLWTWGQNGNGPLGDNTSVPKSSPVQTVAGGNNWLQVSGGAFNAIATKIDGTLWIWGLNNHGQLGDNSLVQKSSPVQTVAGGTNWKLSSAGKYFSGAIKTDGTIWLWGRNTYGQLADGTLTSKSSPVQTISGGTNWKLISCGQYHCSGLKTDGTLWGWGFNTTGQLGDNTITNKSSPVQTVSGGTNWKLVSSGGYHTTGIKTDGTLWTWGQNVQGQLGFGFSGAGADRSSPVQTLSGGTNWKNLGAGTRHSSAIYFFDADNLYPSQ